MSVEVIERSLEAVAEHLGDPTKAVYERLFTMNPALRELFALDDDFSVRGEMLQKVFEMVLDLMGGRHYADGLIATEWMNHQGQGVPPAQFEWFFVAMVDTFREGLGEHWTPAFDEAWQTVRQRVAEIIARLPQAA
jgi:methyl-accepting chemotaxis protein/nitric oxide dioxygenase